MYINKNIRKEKMIALSILLFLAFPLQLIGQEEKGIVSTNENEPKEASSETTGIHVESKDKTYKINTTYKTDEEPQDKPIELKEYYRLIVKTDHPGVHATIKKAQQLSNQKKFPGARKVIADYLVKKPNIEMTLHWSLYDMLAGLWLIEGKLEEGRKVLKEGYELLHDNYLLEDYAFVSYKAGHYDDAAQLYEKLYDDSKGSEKDVRHLEYAAQSNKKLRNWEEAKRIYKRLLDLPGKPEQAWLKNIIAVCKCLNQPEEAETYKKQLKELYGNAG